MYEESFENEGCNALIKKVIWKWRNRYDISTIYKTNFFEEELTISLNNKHTFLLSQVVRWIIDPEEHEPRKSGYVFLCAFACLSLWFEKSQKSINNIFSTVMIDFHGGCQESTYITDANSRQT